MSIVLLMTLLIGTVQAQVDPARSFGLVRPDAPLLASYDLPAQYLLKGATIHTGTGRVITNGQVLVVDGVIREVGTNINAVLHKEVDLTGRHLYPGLISASSPLGLVEIGAVRATRDTTEVGSYTPDVRSWLAINPDSELIPVARAGGVAYSLAVPGGGVVAGQSGLIQLDGWGMEAMAFAKPVALHVNWPRMSLRLAPKNRSKDSQNWKSPADQDQARQKQITELTRFFEDARAYRRARTHPDESFVTVPAWDAMLPYLKREKPVFVHADDLRQIKAALAWSLTNELKIVICGGRDSWMIAQKLATNDIPVVYEHVLEQPARDTEAFDQAYRAPAILVGAGVKTAISLGRGRFSASMARNLSHAAAHAARHGLTEAQALAAITSVPAGILGVRDKIGVIDKGRIATLIATDGPLLDIRSNVRQMWIAGIPVSLENRQTRLYRRYQGRPKRN